MTGLPLILAILTVVASVAFIGYPLVKKEEQFKSLDRSLDFDMEDSLERQKESVFTTLGEIEFDYRMKKLSEGDYSNLSAKYKRQAVALLKAEEDEMKVDGRVAEELEKELEQEIEREIEQEVQQLVKKQDEQ